MATVNNPSEVAGPLRQVRVVAADFVEVGFPDALAIALEFNVLTKQLTDIFTAVDGRDDEVGHGAVRSFQGDRGKAGEAHPPRADHLRVLDPIEFDLVDFLVNDAAGDAEPLTGEFENLGADDEVTPKQVGGGNDKGDPGRRKKQAADGNPAGD